MAISAYIKSQLEAQESEPKVYFIFNGTDYSHYVASVSPISRDADYIVAGNISITLSNTDGTFNTIKANKSSWITKEGSVRIGFGMGLWDNRLWDNLTWGDGAYYLFRGRLEDVSYSGVNVTLVFRDKAGYTFEKILGTSGSPLDFYTSVWNPADMVWSILTTYGGLSSTADASNPDIDYTKWAEWKTTCASIGYNLKAEFKGSSIKGALKKIAFLTNSTIYVDGEGKVVCSMWLEEISGTPETFNSNKITEIPSIDFKRSDVINKYLVSYGYTPSTKVWDGSVTVQDTASQTNYGVYDTDEAGYVWHHDSGSATNFAERKLAKTKDPYEEFSFSGTLETLKLELGICLISTLSFLGWSSQYLKIKKISFQPMDGKGMIYGFLTIYFRWSELDNANIGLDDSDYALI